MPKLTTAPILVVGDMILDEYVTGTSSRLSPEAPVPIIKTCPEDRTYRLGGAANVAANIRALGGSPIPVGVIGREPVMKEFTNLLYEADIQQGLLFRSDRRSTIKTRIIANGGHQVCRLDCEDATKIDTALEDSLLKTVEAIMDKAIAVIISDYNKGVITTNIMNGIFVKAINRNIPVFIDPKIANKHLYRAIYSCKAVLTPNIHEAEGMTGMQAHSIENVERIGREVLLKYSPAHVLITRGEDGMSLFSRGERPHATDITVHHLPTAAQQVFDVSGAGDTVIATLALAYASGYKMLDAAVLANIAAGLAVGKRGTSVVTFNELAEAQLKTIDYPHPFK